MEIVKASEIKACDVCPIGQRECQLWMSGNTSNMYINDPPCTFWCDDDEISDELPENGINALIMFTKQEIKEKLFEIINRELCD